MATYKIEEFVYSQGLYDSSRMSSTDCANPMSNILSTSSITTCLQWMKSFYYLDTVCVVLHHHTYIIKCSLKNKLSVKINFLHTLYRVYWSCSFIWTEKFYSTYFNCVRSSVPLTMWSMILPGVPTTMSSPFLIAPAERVTANKNQQSDSIPF